MVVSLGLAPGCGGGGPDNVEELADELVGALCSKAFECEDSFPGTAMDFSDSFGTSISGCETIFAADFEIDPGLQTAIDDGRVIYSSSNADTCLGLLRGQTCTDLWSGESPLDDDTCDAVFTGTVALEGACTIDEECVSQQCEQNICVPDSSV